MTAPTEPGLYAGVPEDVYHGDRDSLSSTGARRLLEVTPHRWRYEQDNPPRSSAAMDFGTAVHTLVLGTGAPLVDTGYDEWRSNDAKNRVAEIRDEGGVPMRPKEYAAAHAAAENLRNHTQVRRWLSTGEPELTVYYHDEVTGVMLRARLDWVHWIDDHTVLILDLKKSRAPGPRQFEHSALEYGYHCQQPWYQAALAAHGIRSAFVFGVICDQPPYEPYVVELPDRAVELGAARNRRAIDLYAACRESGEWPSHGDHIHPIDLPGWAYKQEEYTS
ncbi:hypothetical protein A5733_04305 [Mycobacterium sp. NS-7484]|uniref:PD-(D/E)XK nuclease-like domain-containing protein n=1 Tax=Mycobacterium sp. NS-7484 TaxID=1834161 RepID=UPI00096DC858|nr:PD-(D/E)XK nuclease-like domain-containing protein [Mycobacterium sp. NS-7484]OMC00339.1 hypothetical protein A5733_04305 [Mycobacterium sp. NS-7484]